MTNLIRYRIYRSRESREYLCVCAARDKRHALAIARQNFHLGRGAYAREEQYTLWDVLKP